jgi:hypothetical protein
MDAIANAVKNLFGTKAERSAILYAELFRNDELVGCVYGKDVDPKLFSDEQKMTRANIRKRLIDTGAISGHLTVYPFGEPDLRETHFLLVSTPNKGAYTLSIGHGKHYDYTDFTFEIESLTTKIKRLDEISVKTFP